jgi:hypothetical protein
MSKVRCSDDFDEMSFVMGDTRHTFILSDIIKRGDQVESRYEQMIGKFDQKEFELVYYHKKQFTTKKKVDDN